MSIGIMIRFDEKDLAEIDEMVKGMGLPSRASAVRMAVRWCAADRAVRVVKGSGYGEKPVGMRAEVGALSGTGLATSRAEVKEEKDPGVKVEGLPVMGKRERPVDPLKAAAKLGREERKLVDPERPEEGWE